MDRDRHLLFRVQEDMLEDVLVECKEMWVHVTWISLRIDDNRARELEIVLYIENLMTVLLNEGEHEDKLVQKLENNRKILREISQNRSRKESELFR